MNSQNKKMWEKYRTNDIEFQWQRERLEKRRHIWKKKIVPDEIPSGET